MMTTDHNIPAWMNRTFGNAEPDNLVAWTRVYTDTSQENWYFTGMVAELLRMRKLPRSFSIALDMDMAVAIIRMEYEPGGDGLDGEDKFRALYTFMDVESFALLWNCKPARIHGYESKAVSLHLKDNGIPWPSQVSEIPTLISFDAKEGEFVVEPDIDNIDSSLLEAA